MMITRKMMALAALPVAAVLAGGGVAVAQAAGTPAGTAVVQLDATHHGGDPCHGHRAAPATARYYGDHGKRDQVRDHRTCDGQGKRDRVRDRDHAGHGLAARTGGGVSARSHCCDGHGHDGHGDE